MLKSIKFRVLSIITAVVMVLGVMGIVGFSSIFASADAVTIEAEGKTSVTIPSTSETEVKIGTSVKSGQYFMYVDVTSFEVNPAESDPDFPTNPNPAPDAFGINAQIGGEYYYFSYRADEGAYYALVSLEQGQAVSFSTYGYILQADVYLGGVQIGGFNNNSLYGVNLPAELGLSDVSGDYYVALSYYGEEGVTFYAQVDGGNQVELTYAEEMYAYVGKITVPAGAKTLKLDASENVTVGVNLYKVVEAAPLPTQAATLALFETEVYYYVSEYTGYYSLNLSATADGKEVDAMFAITEKANPNYFGGTYVDGNNYPLALVAGQTYYFEVVYMGSYDYDMPDEVEVTFAVEKWTTPTLKADETVYAPVSLTEEYAVNVVASEGDYEIILTAVPDNVTEVTVHYGGAELVLTAENGFVGRIYLSGNTTMYLTSDEEFVAGILLGVPTELHLNESVTVTVPAEEQKVFAMYDLKAGTYRVIISGSNNIAVAAGEEIVIEAGSRLGTFTLEEDSFWFEISLLNLSDEAQSVTVRVTKIA